MAIPTIVETIGNGHTVGYGNGSQSFQYIHRAKDKKHRYRIAVIAKESCGKGIKYSQPEHEDYAKFLAKYKNFTSRLKAIRTKAKGHWCDCSGLCQACAIGAGASMGYVTSKTLTSGKYSKYKKYKYSNQISAGTWQRGDIVCRNGHAAVIVDDGPNCKVNFDKEFCKDGSQKINDKKTNQIIKDYCKNWKKNGVNKHDSSISQLQAYIKDLEKQKKIIQNKITNQNKKEKTDARKEYIAKLKKTKKTLKDAIKYAKEKLKKMKKKKTDKNKTKPKNVTKNTSTNNNPDDDEEYAVDGDIDFDDDEDNMNEDKEPQPESIDYYYIRSGPNYFSQGENNVSHKDYLGKTYCKRKLKIKTLVATNTLWDFTFDMPFSSCSKYNANIVKVNKITDNHWQVEYKRNAQGQIAKGSHVFYLKTGLGIEYEIRCDIETYYNM